MHARASLYMRVRAREQYNKLLTDWMDAIKSPDSEARKNTSLALSKWLHETTPKNPFE